VQNIVVPGNHWRQFIVKCSKTASLSLILAHPVMLFVAFLVLRVLLQCATVCTQTQVSYTLVCVTV